MGHARRRRGTARDRRLEPSDFLLGDGVRPGFDGDGTVGSFAEAEREWQGVRVEVWRLWARRPGVRAPRGAVVHDGLETVEDLVDFRERQPRAANAIAEFVDLWVDAVEAHRHSDERMRARRAEAAAAGLLWAGGPVQPARDQQDGVAGLDDEGETNS